jgi:chemotaxis protein MotA
VIDGFEPATVKEIIDTEIYLEFEEEENAGRVFEGAGGFAPTIGIIGAVLGLIHVMSMLNDPSKIGEGIAVAFVATVYGVGVANMFLIPWGTKIKRKAGQRLLTKEVVKLGVVGIQEGLNPHFLREKLEIFVEEKLRGKSVEKAAAR